MNAPVRHDQQPHTERRKDASAAVITLIKHLQESVDSLQNTVTTHINGLEDQRKAIVADLLKEAFPNGDHQAHRRYHENLIKAAEDKAQFWKKMRDELAKWGLLLFAGWVIVSLVQAGITYIQTFHR